MTLASIHSVLGRIVAPALLFALVACGPLPRPFQPDIKAENNSLLMLPDRAGIVVHPVEGLGAAQAADLAERLADALRRENVPATTREGNISSYRLDGTASENGGRAEARLVLRDPTGTVLAERSLSLGGGAVEAAEIAQTAAALAASLQPEAVQISAKPRPGVHVGKVVGAPAGGDGALSRALDYALRRAGIAVLDAPSESGLTVLGEVMVVPKSPELRAVSIVWTVFTPDGVQLGQIRQENDVPVALLERAWPEIAVSVAEGAVEGIADLLDQAPTLPR